jgi:hypothetical protein
MGFVWINENIRKLKIFVTILKINCWCFKQKMKQYLAENIQNFNCWEDISKLEDFSFPWRGENAPETQFQAFHNDLYLHFRFIAFGGSPLVHVKENHKMEVINSERVEIFFRQDPKMSPYYCLEMDPYGRILDYIANYYRRFNYEWKWPGCLSIQTKIEETRYILQGKISFAILEQLNLIQNNEIQIGLFRGYCTNIQNDKATLEWISWIDPKTEKPDFHTPSAFGIIKLKDFGG